MPVSSRMRAALMRALSDSSRRRCARRDSRRGRQRRAVGVEADVVHGPAVDGDGADALGGERRALAQAFMQAGEDAVEVPVQAVGRFDGGVGEAVDELDVRVAVLPAQQRDAAAFGAEIDGDEGAGVGGVGALDVIENPKGKGNSKERSTRRAQRKSAQRSQRKTT
jgi:hypothetical protein